MFARLFSRGPAVPQDPLIERFPEVVVPLSDAPPFARGLVPMKPHFSRAKGRERDAGHVAGYVIVWRRPREATVADDVTPYVQSVVQGVYLMRDRAAAVAAYEVPPAPEDGKTREGYSIRSIPWLADAARLWTLRSRHAQHIDWVGMVINLRHDRLCGTVDVTMFGEVPVERRRDRSGMLGATTTKRPR